MQDFVDGLIDLPVPVRAELKKLTPANYIGNAATQAKNIVRYL